MTVNAHTGYGELPMNPSCTMKLRLPMKIAVQRAQPAPDSSPTPARATTIPQRRVIQPHVLTSHTMIDSAVRTVYLALTKAIKTLEASIEPVKNINQPGKPNPPLPALLIIADSLSIRQIRRDR